MRPIAEDERLGARYSKAELYTSFAKKFRKALRTNQIAPTQYQGCLNRVLNL